MARLQLLRNVELREYQKAIYEESLSQNTLVVLPTGLGKTVIIAYLVAHYLQARSEKLILVATPTKPLVHQTVQRLQEFIDYPSELMVGVSGSITPVKRSKLYEQARVIVGTPQTLNNDLLSGRIDPHSVIFLAIDEAHRATGNYAYVGIIQQLPRHVHVVGFTATPGNTKEQVLEVVNNLRAEHVIAKDEMDPDVRPYVTLHRPERVFVDLPSEYRQALKLIEGYQKDLITTMQEIIEEHELEDVVIQEYLKQSVGTRKTALQLHHHVISLMRDQPEWGNLLTSTANLLRVAHLQDLIETQGLPQAASWLEMQQKKSRSKALQEFFEHPAILQLIHILQEKASPHPKLQRLKKLIESHLIPSESKIMVFSNYRDTVEFLHDELKASGYNVAKFIGQSSKNEQKGMSQKEQVSILEEFKSGSIDVLVSTSVGEEGLDVGNCDLVVFYDSVPSVVRSIQRSGRGRKKRSRVVHLIAKGTRDVGMYYSTKNKNKKIKLFLKIELPSILRRRRSIDKNKQLDQWMTVPTDSARRSRQREEKVKRVDHSLKTMKEHLTLQKNAETVDLTPQPHELEPINSPAVAENDDHVNRGLPEITASLETVRGDSGESLELMMVVDSRESSSVVPRLLKRRGVNITMKTLPVGDYFIPPSVLVERKSHDDFVASLYDGRLFSQAAEMTNQDEIEYRFLILEENRNLATSLRMEAEQGAILSLLLDFNINVIMSRTQAETVSYLISLAKRFQTERRKRLTLPVQSTSTLSLREIRELMLMQITGINKTKAKHILDHFKTLDALFAASVEDLEKTKGIGKILARRIHDVLHADND